MALEKHCLKIGKFWALAILKPVPEKKRRGSSSYIRWILTPHAKIAQACLLAWICCTQALRRETAGLGSKRSEADTVGTVLFNSEKDYKIRWENRYLEWGKKYITFLKYDKTDNYHKCPQTRKIILFLINSLLDWRPYYFLQHFFFFFAVPFDRLFIWQQSCKLF